MSHSPTPWYVDPDNAVVWDADACLVADCAEARVEGELIDRANANRIVACVNACADIPTESLTAMGWQLAPKAGARPTDVAKLLLKMEQYRKALERVANMEPPRDDESKDSLAEALSVTIEIATGALKP